MRSRWVSIWERKSRSSCRAGVLLDTPASKWCRAGCWPALLLWSSAACRTSSASKASFVSGNVSPSGLTCVRGAKVLCLRDSVRDVAEVMATPCRRVKDRPTLWRTALSRLRVHQASSACVSFCTTACHTCAKQSAESRISIEGERRVGEDWCMTL